jgi:hypothetical protein
MTHGKTSGRTHRAAEVSGGNRLNCHEFGTKTALAKFGKWVKFASLSLAAALGIKSCVAQRPLLFFQSGD